MNNRLKEIIQYKTDGVQTEFAELLGWSPPYLAKLMKGKNIGLQPVLSILEKLPEINARWFLLGEGNMLEERKNKELQQCMLDYVHALFCIDKYISVMSPDDLRYTIESIDKGITPHFSPDKTAEWERLISDKEKEINIKFTEAKSKSEKLCKQRIVREL